MLTTGRLCIIVQLLEGLHARVLAEDLAFPVEQHQGYDLWREKLLTSNLAQVLTNLTSGTYVLESQYLHFKHVNNLKVARVLIK